MLQFNNTIKMDNSTDTRVEAKKEPDMKSFYAFVVFLGCMGVISIFLIIYEKMKRSRRLQEMQANPPFQPPLLMHPFQPPPLMRRLLNERSLPTCDESECLPTYDESEWMHQNDLDQSPARIISPLKRCPRQNHLPTYAEDRLLNQVSFRLLQLMEQDAAYFSQADFSQDTQRSAMPPGTPESDESDIPPPPYEEEDNMQEQPTISISFINDDDDEDENDDDPAFPNFSLHTLQQALQGDHQQLLEMEGYAPAPQLPRLQMMQYATPPTEDAEE